MNIQICQLCKDPIWSFICPHCLAREISRWLPEEIRLAFYRFNRNFFRNFSSTLDMDGLRCLRCKKVRLANICPFCYLAEVYDWLHSIKPALADTFFKVLPMKRGLKLTSRGISWSDGIVPITQTELPETDEGVCETCERFSDELTNVDGRWVCRDCELLDR